MFLVNFVGSFTVAPYLMKHHLTFCSYADTIMPQFFFAVGFSLRLSFLRRADEAGVGAAYWHTIKRSLALALVAILWYRGRPSLPEGMQFTWETMKSIGFVGAVWKQLKVDWFQTLLHIAVTTLWILPVIGKSGRWRVLYLLFTASLHLALNGWFYFQWNNSSPKGIDGGTLGFLTWSIPTLVGTLCFDLIQSYQDGETSGRAAGTWLLFWAIALSALGWALSCGTRWSDVPAEEPIPDTTPVPVLAMDPVYPPRETLTRWWNDLLAKKWNLTLAEPPFVPPPHSRDEIEENGKTVTKDLSSRYRPWNYWMMSQQVGSISYLVFSSGVSLLVYLLFFILSELWSVQIGLFRTMGVNPLFGYFIHSIVDDTVKTFMPRDIPAIPMWIGFAVYFGLCWLMLRYLEKNKIFLRL